MLGDCYWLKLTVTVTRNGNDRLSMFGLDHLRIAAITEAADIISLCSTPNNLNMKELRFKR